MAETGVCWNALNAARTLHARLSAGYHACVSVSAPICDASTPVFMFPPDAAEQTIRMLWDAILMHRKLRTDLVFPPDDVHLRVCAHTSECAYIFEPLAADPALESAGNTLRECVKLIDDMRRLAASSLPCLRPEVLALMRSDVRTLSLTHTSDDSTPTHTVDPHTPAHPAASLRAMLNEVHHAGAALHLALSAGDVALAQAILSSCGDPRLGGIVDAQGRSVLCVVVAGTNTTQSQSQLQSQPHGSMGCELADRMTPEALRETLLAADLAGRTVYHHIAASGNPASLRLMREWLPAPEDRENLLLRVDAFGHTPVARACSVGDAVMTAAFLLEAASCGAHSGARLLNVCGFGSARPLSGPRLHALGESAAAGSAACIGNVVRAIQGDWKVVFSSVPEPVGAPPAVPPPDAAELDSALQALTHLTTRSTTALHLAAERGHGEAVQALLEAGARVDFVDSLGETPSHRAARCGAAAAATLLARRLDSSQLTEMVRTALEAGRAELAQSIVPIIGAAKPAPAGIPAHGWCWYAGRKDLAALSSDATPATSMLEFTAAHSVLPALPLPEAPLAPEQWEFRIGLGAFGTVAGTTAISALHLPAPASTSGASATAMLHISVRGQVADQRRYAVCVPLQWSNDGRWSTPIPQYFRHDADFVTFCQLTPDMDWQPYRKDALTFMVSDPALRTVILDAHVHVRTQSRAAFEYVGSTVLTSDMLSETTSNTGVASTPSTPRGSVWVRAAPAAQPMRSQGQTCLSLAWDSEGALAAVGMLSRGDSNCISIPQAATSWHGLLALRYALVRGYSPRLTTAAQLLKAAQPFAGLSGPLVASLLVGHRGSGADNAAVVAGTDGRYRYTHFLENTPASLVAAAEAGADMVEFDVQLTRDGVPVVHHDWGVKVPMPGCGSIRVPVSHLTVAQFLALPPQFMNNDGGTDEGSIALAADARITAAFGGDAAAITREGDAPMRRASPSRRRSFAGSTAPDPWATWDQPGVDVGGAAAMDRRPVVHDSFATLADMLRIVPQKCGFNIEVKYPVHDETSAFGIRPLERNSYVERILDVVFEHAGSRRIMFSCFDPDTCVTLMRKQTVYPVLFLTEGGTPDVILHDVRMTSLGAAVEFARGAGLSGVVTDVKPLVACPALISHVQVGARPLALASYGRLNNDPRVASMQRAAGMAAVIVDHVARIRKAWGSHPPAGASVPESTATTAGAS